MRASRAFVVAGLAGLALLAGGHTTFAQDTNRPAFEVASVRPSPSPSTSRGIRVFPGRFTSVDLPVMPLIRRAYGVAHWKIKNAPDWVNREPFNIQATFPASATPAEVNAMLRTLLEQRFRLSVQLEKREMDADALIVADPRRGLGAGMHPVDVDCETKELRQGSAPGLFSTMKERPACGSSMVTVTFGDPSNIRRVGATRWAALTMANLAETLANSLQRPVTDRTGLSGQFDVALEYATNAAPSASLDGRPVAAMPGEPPALPEALERQLGLKLQRERERVEVELVIVRSIERPRDDEN